MRRGVVMSMPKGRSPSKSIRLSFGLIAVLFFTSQLNAFVYWTVPAEENAIFAWSGGGSSYGYYGDLINYDTIVDTFEFAPPNFIAQTGTSKIGKIFDLLQFNVSSKNGPIQKINLTEQGEFEINGSGYVTAFGSLTIQNLDNALESVQKTVTVVFNGSRTHSGEGQAAGTWQGNVSIDLTELDYDWTNIGITLTNNLFANNTSGLNTFIKKDAVGAGSENMNIQVLIPEPATLAIFSFGLLIFPFTKKRFTLQVILFALFVLGAASSSNAANYVYNGSYSSTSTDSEGFIITNDCFGTPKLDLDNTFIFRGLTFSTDNYSTSPLNGVLTIDIYAIDGYKITSVGLIESGEFFIDGYGKLDVSGNLQVAELGGSYVSPLVDITTSANIPSELPGYDFWNASGYVNCPELTGIRLTINNILLAQASDEYTYSSISTINFKIPLTVIPEPATVALLTVGLSVFIKRKK